MNILILCKKFPYPLKEGEPIATAYLSRALAAKGCKVSLLVLNTSKHYFDPKLLPEKDNHYHQIYSVEINNDITITGALKCLIQKRSYILSRFISKNYASKLQSVLKSGSFDIVQLETIYMSHYIPFIREVSDAIIALRTHNVEHKIWEGVAANMGYLKKWYLNLQIKYLKRLELAVINDCDVLVAITENDLNNFKKSGLKKEGLAIPVGFNTKEYETDFKPDSSNQSIAFIGALDWMPNQHGVVWFLEKVWPLVHAAFPNMEFHIAGKNTPDWIKQKVSAKVIIHGEVPDAKSFIKQHPVLIAPLFSGSGIKIKILEGLALGRAVITTSTGIEGIPAIHEQHLFIANNEQEFFHAIHHCFSPETDILKLRQSGRSLLYNKFDSDLLSTKILATYQRFLAEKLIVL